MLSAKTSLLLSMLLHVHSFILIIVLTSLRTQYPSKRNNLYEIYSDRNVVMAVEIVLEMVQLAEFSSARSGSLLQFADLPLQTNFLHLDLLSPKW